MPAPPGAGRFMVPEDNVRTPSGSAYALAASEAVEGELVLLTDGPVL